MHYLAGLGFITFLVGTLAAWITHILYCLQTAKYLLLIAGGIVPPVGVIHGIAIWLGMPWA